MNYMKVLIDILSSKEYIPLTIDKLMKQNQIFDAYKSEVQEFLTNLTKLQVIFILKDGTYALSKDVIVGRFETATPHFGFIRPNVEGEEDLFIGERNMNSSMNGDYVIAKKSFSNKKDKTEGRIVYIVEQSTEKIVGIFEDQGNFGFVRPDNKKYPDIFIPKRNFNVAKGNYKVVVEITKRATDSKSAEGSIVEVIGHKDKVGVDLISIIKQYNIPTEFPNDVIRECRFILGEIPPQELMSELNHRRDLRNKTIMTIDGDDTKDYDDAVSIEMTPEGHYLLGVHIADVTHYVKENAPLDKEAIKRGTSVYMPGKVIPMLPEKLSNGICSLNPKVNRFTLSCLMTIDKDGNVIKSELCESVIKTVERMTYKNVDKIIQREPEMTEKYSHILKDIDLMYKLSLILQKKRDNRHAINFDFPEAKVILDENGKVTDIKLRHTTAATQLIEEFMIICNEVVSEVLTREEIPFLYRIHEAPSDEKEERFFDFMRIVNPDLIPVKLTQQNIREILDFYKDKPEGQQVNSVMLRSLSKAKYSSQPLGHFGLASIYYSHFTSPIRRYPDLQIHRIVKEYLRGNISDLRKRQLTLILPEVARQSTETEITAAKCEMETVRFKMCEFMSEHIGEQFEGVVSGITDNGIFISLPNTIEGFVWADDLNKEEFYLYNEDTYSYISTVDPSRKYTFGTSVKVEVVSVDMEKKKINFTLVAEDKSKEEKDA